MNRQPARTLPSKAPPIRNPPKTRDMLAQAVKEAEDLLKESAFGRFSEWLKTDVEVSGLTLGGVKAEFKKRQQSILQHLRNFDLAREEKVMSDCREFIRDMADIVKRRWQVEKVVLLVDSLERLRGVGSTAVNEMFERLDDPDAGGPATPFISAAIEAGAAPVIRHNPHVTSVLELERPRGVRRLLYDWQTARLLRTERFDIAIDFHGGPRSAWLVRASGAPRKAAE